MRYIPDAASNLPTRRHVEESKLCLALLPGVRHPGPGLLKHLIQWVRDLQLDGGSRGIEAVVFQLVGHVKPEWKPGPFRQTQRTTIERVAL